MHAKEKWMSMLSYPVRQAEPAAACVRAAETRPMPGAARDAVNLLIAAYLSLGIPADVMGFPYLVESTRLVVEQPELLNALTKALYPAVAASFGTTPSKVERAMRHAIDAGWRRGRVEALNELMGCRMVCQQDKPRTGELIGMIATRVRCMLME